MTIKKIGFIGIGVMGSSMANFLVRQETILWI